MKNYETNFSSCYVFAGESLKTAKEQLAMANLRNQRLKEVFSKKIQEFRQV